MTDEIYRLLVAASYAIPSFALSARFYHVWRAPLEVEEGRWINFGVGVLAMEFILLHAGTFLGAQAVAAGSDGNRLLGIAGILAFEQGVLFELLFDKGRELDIGQLQQLDRLLQLRRHHQRLALPDL